MRNSTLNIFQPISVKSHRQLFVNFANYSVKNFPEKRKENSYPGLMHRSLASIGRFTVKRTRVLPHFQHGKWGSWEKSQKVVCIPLGNYNNEGLMSIPPYWLTFKFSKKHSHCELSQKGPELTVKGQHILLVASDHQHWGGSRWQHFQPTHVQERWRHLYFRDR